MYYTYLCKDDLRNQQRIEKMTRQEVQDRITKRSQELNVTLTVSETLFLTETIRSLQAEEGYSDTTVGDVAKRMEVLLSITGFTPKAKGILGSLVKKDVLWTEEYQNGFAPKDYFLHLTQKWVTVHPDWYPEGGQS